jgi:tetratricopeptide (TPR) repeat protein
VRCNYCHPGGDPNTLEGVDFAADSLRTKRVARLMLEMVGTVNRTTLAEAEPDSTKRIELECFTCHRGVARPERLDHLLFRVARDHGLDSAAAEYRRLREAYYGQAAYDFGERSLVLAADLLRRAARYPEALGLLGVNLELFPRSAETFAVLGATHAAAGDTVNAISAYRRALELSPNSQFLVQQIRRLGG